MQSCELRRRKWQRMCLYIFCSESETDENWAVAVDAWVRVLCPGRAQDGAARLVNSSWLPTAQPPLVQSLS